MRSKAGTKMGKLQLRNTVDDSVLNCILWEETLNRFLGNYYTTGSLGFVTKIIEAGITPAS